MNLSIFFLIQEMRLLNNLIGNFFSYRDYDIGRNARHNNIGFDTLVIEKFQFSQEL